MEGAPSEDSGYVEAYLGVSADCFRAMGTAFLEGRPFTASDHAESTRVAIVSEKLARRYWGDESPVGRRIRFGSDPRQPRHGGEQFPWFTAYLLTAFAALAVFLAAVGVYGVLAYSMSRRIREIGVRVAIGARRGDVFGLLFKQGVGVILAGLALGLPLSLGAARLLRGLLYGVDPTSVEVLGGGVLALTLVGAAAACLPAWRAVRIDPMESLRQE